MKKRTAKIPPPHKKALYIQKSAVRPSVRRWAPKKKRLWKKHDKKGERVVRDPYGYAIEPVPFVRVPRVHKRLELLHVACRRVKKSRARGLDVKVVGDEQRTGRGNADEVQGPERGALELVRCAMDGRTGSVHEPSGAVRRRLGDSSSTACGWG